jgi:hypothetical protein
VTPELARWIRQHPFRWEVRPLDEIQNHQIARIGLGLTLSADSGGCGFRPGCPQHRSLYEGLRAVALEALPASRGAIVCQIEPYDGATHLDPKGKPRVELSIHIVHAQGYFRALDSQVQAAARSIAARLAEMLSVSAGTASVGDAAPLA